MAVQAGGLGCTEVPIMRKPNMPSIHAVPDEIPDVLREQDGVTVNIHPDVPFVIFADALVRAGLVIRGDGRGGILIAKGERL